MYTFRFAARNDVGLGYFSHELNLRMPRRSVPEAPKIILPDLNPNLEHEEITSDTIVEGNYADHFELRWTVPHDNGDPIDSYSIKYCIVSSFRSPCSCTPVVESLSQ